MWNWKVEQNAFLPFYNFYVFYIALSLTQQKDKQSLPYSSVPNSRASTQHVFAKFSLTHALIRHCFLLLYNSTYTENILANFPQITLISPYMAIRHTRVFLVVILPLRFIFSVNTKSKGEN